jgi:hypothetical protein
MKKKITIRINKSFKKMCHSNGMFDFVMTSCTSCEVSHKNIIILPWGFNFIIPKYSNRGLFTFSSKPHPSFFSSKPSTNNHIHPLLHVERKN